MSVGTGHRPLHGVVIAVLSVVLAGCTGVTDGGQAESTPTTAAQAVSTGQFSAADRSTASSDVSERAEVDASPIVALRTASTLSPAEPINTWQLTSPLPTGLQRRLGPDDLLGPLRQFRPLAIGQGYEVTDRCEHPDLAGAYAGLSTGGPLSEWGIWARQRNRTEQRLVRCTVKRFEVSYNRGQIKRFPTRAQAMQWIAQRQNEALRSRSFPFGAGIHGFASSETSDARSPFRVMFAPWDAPVDEVRILPETVAVREGVLRGLVRNWSRHLWAYEVTISAEGHGFAWPLSVQPGEIAPFEIHGWDGPVDASVIEFAVDADMSWHVDPSRAFERGFGPTLWVGATTKRPLPESLRDRYPALTADIAPNSVSVGIVRWDTGLGIPNSHPSLADEIGASHEIGDLVVADLRGYGMVFDYAGRVLDVGPAMLTTGRSSIWKAQRRPVVEVSSIPVHGSEHPEQYSLDVRLDVHVAGPEPRDRLGEYYYADLREFDEERWYRDTFDGGFVLWVGAAYPGRNAE